VDEEQPARDHPGHRGLARDRHAAAYALSRLKFFAVPGFGTGIFVTYLVPTSLLFLPLAQVVNWLGLAIRSGRWW
jgi:ABC-type glycerol-3-phosphate transport system permease component